MGRGPHQAHLQAAAGRQMARRQVVHRRRRKMHLGHADRQIAGQAAAQPAQGLVSEPRRRRAGRRLRGDICAEALAAGLSDAAGERHVAGLSVPRPGARYAHPPGRHGTLQIRRIQAERIHPGGQESGLLETRAAVPRWHRMDDHTEPVNPNARFHRRQVRHEFSVRSHLAVECATSKTRRRMRSAR